MNGENGGGGAPAPSDLAYEDIEAAVMETGRGRQFLAEFARRNRHADTERLLAAIQRIEQNMDVRSQATTNTEMEGMRTAVFEMAEQIAAAKREIAAIRTPNASDTDIADATAELDAIVTSTEGATSDILSAAEQIQEIAWTLREEGASDIYCTALDERATEIYTACSFQDITGQRTSKVVRVLQLLDERINTMAELWSGGTVTTRPATASVPQDERHLLNGPALEGNGVDQDEVDRMLADDVNGDDGQDAEIDEAAIDVMFEAVINEVANADAPGGEGAGDEPLGEAGDEAADDGPDLSQLSRRDYEALFG